MGFDVTDNMRADIKKAVEELERSTTGEMVCVITRSSARYILFPILWASLIALLLPLANLFTPEHMIGYAEQAGAFILLVTLLGATSLCHKVTPSGICVTNCRRFAFEQFFIQKLNETKKRSGVMLFVSLDEKYVELLADKGISDKVESATWDKIVDDFIGDVRAGKVHEGYLKAIAACQEILKTHFPDVPDDINELGDNLIELPRAEFIS